MLIPTVRRERVSVDVAHTRWFRRFYFNGPQLLGRYIPNIPENVTGP